MVLQIFPMVVHVYVYNIVCGPLEKLVDTGANINKIDCTSATSASNRIVSVQKNKKIMN